MLPGLARALSVAAGGYHSCAALADGSTRCWGQNSSRRARRRLGDSIAGRQSRCFRSPRRIGSPPPDATPARSCTTALHDGTVQCWGGNDSGELGDDASVDQVFPLPVAGVTNAVALASGFDHNCALLASGAVVCWGANESGQLGNGSTTDSDMPVAVVGLPARRADRRRLRSHLRGASRFNAALLGIEHGWAAGRWDHDEPANARRRFRPHASRRRRRGKRPHRAATSDGSVYCWGSNDSGELGDGTTTNHLIPAPVVGLASVNACGGRKTGTSWTRVKLRREHRKMRPSGDRGGGHLLCRGAVLFTRSDGRVCARAIHERRNGKFGGIGWIRASAGGSGGFARPYGQGERRTRLRGHGRVRRSDRDWRHGRRCRFRW